LLENDKDFKVQTQVANSILDQLIKQEHFEKAWSIFTILKQ